MLIIGCDFHTRYQQIAMADDCTGELLVERRLDHEGLSGFESVGPLSLPWSLRRYGTDGTYRHDPHICGALRTNRRSGHC
jgi:hypothetical protein